MPLSERRQIENEMIFRRLNEKVGDGLDKLDRMHKSDNNPDLLWKDSDLLEFKCECSDEDCHERIPIKLNEYRKMHTDRDSFIVKLQHQVEKIEEVILTKDTYCVVRKHNSTAEPSDQLNSTSIKNT